MIRKIIHINEDTCTGCGLCADACHEGAIQMIDGKAVLTREDYCDGLGDCLPSCPVGAITFEEREAPAYDQEAVDTAKKAKQDAAPLPCGCPGSASKTIHRTPSAPEKLQESAGCLSQWPVQIKLVPLNAPYFQDANLLVAADCSAYACGDFHSRFIKNHVTLIGCPKLDEGDYSEKLTEIISRNSIKSLTVVRMEVPCCGGIEHAAVNALKASGKFIPWQVVTIGIDGSIKS